MRNITLYFSAFVPMYLLVIVKFVVGIIFDTIELSFLSVLTIAIYSLLSLLGIFGLIWNMFIVKGKTIKIKVVSSVNITDQHFLSYFSLFVLFALGFQLTMPSMLIISFLIIIYVAIVYINNKMFYINPLLNILGYNFFDITYTKEGSEELIKNKVFCRGKLPNKAYIAHIQNESFYFIDKN